VGTALSAPIFWLRKKYFRCNRIALLKIRIHADFQLADFARALCALGLELRAAQLQTQHGKAVLSRHPWRRIHADFQLENFLGNVQDCSLNAGLVYACTPVGGGVAGAEPLHGG
jgi:hypothetical protein